jgi:hypothetical protein
LRSANRRLDAALRGRDWSARALREAAYRITSDAVIGLYGRITLHHDRVVTPSGAFPLCGQVSAGVETAHLIAAGGEDLRALEARLQEASGLPWRYRPRPEPPPLPALRV